MSHRLRKHTTLAGALHVAALLIASTAAGQTASPPPGPSTSPGPSPTPTVWVHVDGADGASLQQDESGDDDWKTICQAPCDQLAPLGSWYRIAGRGLIPSDDFALDAPAGGRADLRVAGASRSWRRGGEVLVGGGFLTALIGGYILYLHYVLDAIADSQGKPRPTTIDPVIGFALAGAGGAVGIVGLVPVVANYQTTVAQSASPAQTPPASAVPASPPAASAAWSTPESRRVPPPFGLPIFVGTF
ncbi:MAG TPA: hypothetical protein VKU41_29940 [Polyangiaceae bacterium]|nr:hypothetical protein [Polyangiaceae bacterium]